MSKYKFDIIKYIKEKIINMGINGEIEELIISIMNVYVAKINGLRKYKKKIVGIVNKNGKYHFYTFL